MLFFFKKKEKLVYNNIRYNIQVVNRIEFWIFMTFQRECTAFKADYEIGGNVGVSSTDRSRSQR